MNITLIIALVSAIVSGIAGFALAWQLQAGNITQLKLEHANERITQGRAARVVADRQQNTIIAAQNAAAGRAVAMRRDDAGLRTVVDGLRDDLDVTRRAAGTVIDACNRHAATVSQLLVESATVNRELAQAADGHASDVRTLSEAWPK
jgi:hypothetical protein